jgi:hypothetical protein
MATRSASPDETSAPVLGTRNSSLISRSGSSGWGAATSVESQVGPGQSAPLGRLPTAELITQVRIEMKHALADRLPG